MTNSTIAQQRLSSQLIVQHPFEKPAEVVSWLGAVQAQDYAAARWALGLRLPGTMDNVIEQAFNDGSILRTHVMRPTWHFVSPLDIRWLLALTAPRIHTTNVSMYRAWELDEATCRRCNDVLVKTLQGGKHLTRSELAAALQLAGIAADNLLRITYIIMRAELDGIICSGARRGKQFTYALLDERAPQSRMLDREEALATLTLRYFSGHGPATLHDFVWWSGLTMADAKMGLAAVSSQLASETLDEQTYWLSPILPVTPTSPSTPQGVQRAYLLPNYDEYTVGYKDRSAVIDDAYTSLFDTRGSVMNNVIILDSQVIGSWRRTVQKDGVTITPRFFVPLNADETDAVRAAIKQYGIFLGSSVRYHPSTA